MTEPQITIKCPHCGYEYLPCEIFYPDDFLGTACDIVRDDNNKIIFFNNDNMNLFEEYTCDGCGKTFKVEAEVKFKAKKEEIDFDEDFVETLN